MNKSTAREIISGNIIRISTKTMQSVSGGESNTLYKHSFEFKYDADGDDVKVLSAIFVVDDVVGLLPYPEKISLENFGLILKDALKNNPTGKIEGTYSTSSVRIQNDD